MGTLQILLNYVSNFTDSITPITVDLIFGASTENAVRAFQTLYGIAPTGIVDRETWNALLDAYNAILRILPDDELAFPGVVLTEGMQGEDVQNLQRLINAAAVNNSSIPSVTED